MHILNYNSYNVIAQQLIIPILYNYMNIDIAPPST